MLAKGVHSVLEDWKYRMHECTANLAFRMDDVESHLPIDGEERLIDRHFFSA
jgi:hypothetical protein